MEEEKKDPGSFWDCQAGAREIEVDVFITGGKAQSLLLSWFWTFEDLLESEARDTNRTVRQRCCERFQAVQLGRFFCDLSE